MSNVDSWHLLASFQKIWGWVGGGIGFLGTKSGVAVFLAFFFFFGGGGAGLGGGSQTPWCLLPFYHFGVTAGTCKKKCERDSLSFNQVNLKKGIVIGHLGHPLSLFHSC